MKTTALLIALLALFVIAAHAQAPQEKWATLDGNKIRHLDFGDAKAKNALVFVHCWTCNVDFWRDQVNAFPQYRVIAMDLPGHGKSDKPKIEYTIEHFAKAVDAVMADAGVKKAVLAGHSMGTPVIRKYYELYPKKVLGLVVVDGSLVPYGNRAELEKFFEPLYKDYKNAAAGFIDGMLPTEPTLRTFIRSSMLATPDYVGMSAMKLMNDDAYAEHGKLNVPVLAIMAPSPYWPKDIETKYKEIAPSIEFQMWPGTTHFLHMERPKEFNGQLKAFIIRKKLL